MAGRAASSSLTMRQAEAAAEEDAEARGDGSEAVSSLPADSRADVQQVLSELRLSTAALFVLTA